MMGGVRYSSTLGRPTLVDELNPMFVVKDPPDLFGSLVARAGQPSYINGFVLCVMSGG